MDKKYLKNAVLYVLTSLLSLGVILYIGYHLFFGLTQKIETAPASPETIQNTILSDVYLFRAETLLRSQSGSGSVVAAVSDGTRVGIGDTVARRYDLSSPDIVAAIREADEQIRVLTAMCENTLSVRDTVSIDRDIYDIMQKIASSARDGDGDGATAYRGDLRLSLIRRDIVTGAATAAETELARVKAERAALIRELGACRETSTVSKSGYFYASADGYETIFTADTAREMTVSDFRALYEADAQPLADSVIGKLVTEHTWYAACLLSRSEAENLTEGEDYPVSFPYNGETSVRMTLSRMVREGDTVMLVFEADTMPQDFSYTRLQPAVIADTVYTGLRVPASAVRVVDGVTGVYVLQGSVMHYRAVKLIVEGEDWCLLENAPEEDPPEGYTWLRQNEIVITKGRRLAEGRILQ